MKAITKCVSQPGVSRKYINEHSYYYSAKHKREQADYWSGIADQAEKDGSRPAREIAAMRRVAQRYRNESQMLGIVEGK